jgi:hypothetical protein
MDPIEPEQLAAALVKLNEWALEHRREPDADELSTRLREHLGTDPPGLPVVSRGLEGYQRANFQVAIERYLEGAGREAELVGLPMTRGYRVGLAELLKGGSRQFAGDAGEAGPIEYEPVDVGDRRIMCVAAGLWLIRDGGARFVLMLRRSDHGPRNAELGVEIVAPERAGAERLLSELERLMRELNPYRGHVLVLSGSQFGGVGVEVQRLPPVTAEQIVLPGGVLERIERHTKTFSEHADSLRAAGRHLKRGLLLHGPPGTGKTLTVMYLSELMPERTVVLLTGNALSAIGAVSAACAMARELAPATLVMEDVDLVAENRMRGQPTTVLFELLNELDGLAEDTDVIFVLTTNRPEVIEPALASRPGRIDLAVAMPLPDAGGRARLLDLYGAGLRLELADRARLIAATEGVTPAFIREALRRAALMALERGAEATIDEVALLDVVRELRDDADRLTSSLLGGPASAGADSARGTPPGT